MPREEKPRIPPERKAVSEFHTPSPAVVFFSELVNRDDPAYYQNAPVARGTLYSTIVGGNQQVTVSYPNLYFLRERKFAQSDQLVFWDWATVPEAEDTYNAEASYVSEAVTFPAFTRVYTVRRDDYEATPFLTIGSTLTGLLGVTITNGGEGFTYATGSIDSTGATVQFVVSGGSIISGVVTNEGSGVTATSTIEIAGDGSPGSATVIPIVQPISCVLVAQKKQELPPDDPLAHEFVRVIRVYETLPGPWIFSTKIDEDGDTVTVQTRRNIAANIVTSETLVGTLWQETTKKGVDNFVAEETMESRTVPGDDVLTTSRVDEDGKTITVTRGIESAATVAAISPREFITTGVWYRISSEPITDLKVWKVIESRVVPGNSVPSTVAESDNVIKFTAEILKDTTLITPSVSQSGGIITKVDKEEVSDIVSKEVTSTKAIFDADYFAVRIPIVIPEKFRAIKPTRTEAHVLAGTASMPTLGAGEFERSAEQLATFVEKTSVTSIDTTTLPVSLTEYKMTPDGQIETIVETLDNGLQTISPDVLTVEAEVDNLGAGISLKVVGTVPSLFTRPAYTISIPDAIPERFRVVAPTTTTALEVAGTASVPTLGTGDLEKSQTQETEFKYRSSTTTRAAVTLPVSLTSYKMYSDGQVETIVETLATGLQTITPTTLYVEAEVQNLGNNTSLQTIGTVPTVFNEARYSSRIPDAIPERFRVIVPTTITSLVSSGTASAPTLGTGDLSIEEQQLTEFHLRTTTETRAGVSLPVSLVSYKMTGEQQVETLTETLATGLQTITPDSLTAEADVANLGNNTSLKSFGTVASVFGANLYEITRPDLLPEKFRVTVPTTVTEVITAGTASLPSLGTGEFSRSQKQLTAFKINTRVTSRASVSLPISLITTKMTSDGQVETITETLATGFQTFTPNATMVEAEVEDLGDGTSIMSVGTVPSLFTKPSYTVSIPDAIPERFRVVAPTTETEIRSAGTATTPTLGTGDLEITQAQLNEFVLSTRTKTRSAVTLPVSLTSYKLTSDQQLETIVETLASGLQTITPANLLIEAEVQNLGNATSLLTQGTVATLFDHGKYSSRIPDVVPERFRVAIPTQTTSLVSSGTAAMPSLSAGQLSKEEEQLTAFHIRTTTEARASVSLPVTLTSYKYSKDKQVITLTETYNSGLQTITPAALTVEAEVINTGDGNSLQSIGTVTSLFTRPSYTTEIPDPIPEKFRVVAPTSITVIDSIGTAAAPTLATGDLEITQSQVDEFVMRTSTKTRSGVSLPISLTNYRMSKDKQVVTEVETLATGLQTITPTATTSNAEVINLGNGTSLASVGTVTSLFTGKSTSIMYEDLVPREFRGVVPTYETDLLVAGTIVDPPVVSTGDLEKTESQIDTLTKRVRTKTRSGISLPVTLTGGKKIVSKYGLQLVADEVITLEATGTGVIPTGEFVIEAEIKQIGSGMEVLTSLIADGSAFPLLHGTHVDEKYGVVIGITKQIVAAGTVGGIIAGAYTEVKPLDQWRSISIASKLDPTTLPAPVQWQTTANHTFPNELLSASFLSAWASNGADYSLSIALLLDMTKGYSGSCLARVTETFTNGPPTSTIAVTQFFPQQHMVGYAWWFASANEVKSSAKTFFIPPSLHGLITLSGGVVQNQISSRLISGFTLAGGRVFQNTSNDFTATDLGATLFGSCLGNPPAFSGFAKITKIISSSQCQISFPATCSSGPATFEVQQTAVASSDQLAATTPTSLPHGTYMVKSVNVERWRFGVFYRRMVEILVP